MARAVWLDFESAKRSLTIPQLLSALGREHEFTYNHDRTKLSGPCPIKSHQHGPTPNKDQFKAQLKDGLWQFYCFGDCGAGGSSLTLAAAILGCDYGQLRRWLLEKFPHLGTVKPKTTKGEPMAAKEKAAPAAATSGMNLASTSQGAEEKAAQETSTVPSEPPALKALPSSTATQPDPTDGFKILRYSLKLDYGHAYLTKERGIAEATARAFGVGFCLNEKSMMKGRLVFPLYHPRQPEHVVGFQGRWAGEDYNGQECPKYLLPPNLPKSKVLFGWPQVLNDPTSDRPVLIVESALSVLRLYPHYAAVATLGAQLSDDHATLLTVALNNRLLVLMYDGDAAGVAGARAAAAKLVTRAYLRVVRLEEEQQPDTLNNDQLRHYLSFIPSPGE